MNTRANWHMPDLVGVEDPFGVAVEEVGTPIALREPHADLSVELVGLVRREGELYLAGVDCEIKARPDTSCFACPLNNRGELCKIGRAQESVCTRLAVESRGARD